MPILECKCCGNPYIEGGKKPCCCDEFQACIDGLKAENEALKAQLAAARDEAKKWKAYFHGTDDAGPKNIEQADVRKLLLQAESEFKVDESALAEGEAVAE